MFEIYNVQKGDTIDLISAKYNITPSNLYKLNGFRSEYVPSVGSNIIVPKNNNKYFNYYTVQKGDSLFKIAKEYNTNYELLAILNGLENEDYIYPNQVIVVPNAGVNVYITKDGDTLNGVINGIKANPMLLLNQNSNIYLTPDQIIVYKER